MSEEILTTIKLRGYWQVIIYPKVFSKYRIPTLSGCQEIVKKSAVLLRGWDYPHFPTGDRDYQEIYNKNDFVESWINWGAIKELWRMYQSGQFIHIFSMIEDWYAEDGFFVNRKHIPPGASFEIVHVTYRIAEIFEFIKRLANQKIYQEGINLEIKIFGTKGRILTLNDPRRLPLWEEYRSNASEILVEGSYSEQELISKSEEMAVKAILRVFEQFNWNNPPVEIIKTDQRNLLEKKT